MTLADDRWRLRDEATAGSTLSTDDGPLRKSELRSLAEKVEIELDGDETVADLRAMLLHEVGYLTVPDGDDCRSPLTKNEINILLGHIDEMDSDK